MKEASEAGGVSGQGGTGVSGPLVLRYLLTAAFSWWPGLAGEARPAPQGLPQASSECWVWEEDLAFGAQLSLHLSCGTESWRVKGHLYAPL